MLKPILPEFSTRPWLERSRFAPLAGVAVPTVDRLLGLTSIRAIYPRLEGAEPAAFARKALDELGVTPRVRDADVAVPATGGAIVVANHPYGGLDGLALIAALAERRRDVRVLGNAWLAAIPELRPILVPVDVFGPTPGSNAVGLRGALRHVAGGGLLLVFPAGEVASMRGPGGVVTDPPWPPAMGRFLRLAAVPVVPAFVAGANGHVFQALGLVHPSLRTARLPAEMLNKRGREIAVTFGRAIEPRRFARADDAAVATHARLRVYALEAAEGARAAAVVGVNRVEPCAEAEPADAVAAEMAALPPGARVAALGEIEVWRARAAAIPTVLREIGRLRETTFRAAGEGTGRARDLDAYDADYEHLVAWHPGRRHVVGAYRFARTDDVPFDRLYTRTLFAGPAAWHAALGPALELGRSFIRAEYQRSFSALLVLWRAIAKIPCDAPRYRVLFGPASVSADYQPESRALIVEFLRRRHAHPWLRWTVRGRRPPSRAPRLLRHEALSIPDLDALDRLVRDIEPDGKGVPVLLMQYLRLGATVAAFNVDAAFADALDVLVIADLRRADPALLERYMGAEGAASFLRSVRRGRGGDALSRRPTRPRPTGAHATSADPATIRATQAAGTAP